MINLNLASVEAEVIKAVEDINSNLKIGATVNGACCPGDVGFASQVLLTIMSRLEDSLGITIPHNIYIFHDKDTNRQLSINEAANKIIKVAEDGK